MLSRAIYATIVIILLLSGAPAFCQSDSLVLSSAAVVPGGSVALNLSLTSSSSAPAGIEWTLTYSPANIVAISASAGAAATAAGKFLLCSGTPGSYTCLLTGSNTTLIQNGVVAVVNVTISAGITQTFIGIANELATSAYGKGISITATGGSITTGAPVNLTSLTCYPNELTSQGSSACTVTLTGTAPDGGVAVTLMDSSASLTVPPSVTIPAGNSTASFTAAAGTIRANQMATVTASLNGASRSFWISLGPPMGGSSINCNPAALPSGTSATCTITLNQAAPSGGVSVSLSRDSTVLIAPASAIIRAGYSSATFPITAGTIGGGAQSATLTATLNGASQRVSLLVTSNTAISSLVCYPANLNAGADGMCTVSISALAPQGGVAVPLSEDGSAVTAPSSVIVPSGSSMATFPVTAVSATPGADTAAVVTATLNGSSQSASFNVMCPCSFWRSTAEPSNPASNSGQAVEVGMQFVSTLSGYVTGVRFYKGPANLGTHVGNLWSSAGRLLAAVTFENETASGWQTAYFPSPVEIAANTIYVISYHAPQGHTAADDGFFTGRATAAPFQVLADGQHGPNGVYVRGSGGFPNHGASATNFWVDLVFNISPTIGTGAPASLWEPAMTPHTPASPASQPAELGLRFDSDVAGYVTGVRFYKGPDNTGSHRGSLWTATGTLLGSVTFTNEWPSGWQQANFATPIPIKAHTMYVVSYWSPAAHFADDAGYFATSGATHQMLYAPPDGQYGPNGVYGTGSGFPTGAKASSNYWVDVIFTPAIQ